MDLTPHEQKILDLVKKHPEVLDDRDARAKLAEEIGLSEKTLRNRIGDLKKYGVLGPEIVQNRQSLSKLNEGSDTYNSEPNRRGMVEFLAILTRHRKVFISTVLTITILTAVISLLMPKTFQTSAVIMTPSYRGSNVNLMSAISNISFGNFNLGGPGSEESMTYIAILKSRTMLMALIQKLDLMEYYEAEDMDDALELVSNLVDFDLDEEGTVRITTQAKTGWFSTKEEELIARKLVKDMGAFFVEKLDGINKELKTEQAQFQRIFIERRLQQNIQDLQEAEENYKSFHEKHGMIAIPEQTTAAITVAAEIQAEVMANEVKLAVLNKTVQPNHPDIVKTQTELQELREKLSLMEYNPDKEQDGAMKVFPAFSNIPELGVKLVRLQREMEVQNTLYTFLVQQFEEAKLREARDTPTLQILDQARTPINRIRPVRTFMVYIAGIIGTFLGIFFAYSMEYIQRTNLFSILKNIMTHKV